MIPEQDTIDDAFEEAPQYVQKYITSVALAVAFESIRETRKIHLDEMEKLGRALNAVFLELQPMGHFPDLLREALEQNKDTFEAVLGDVNENIFKPFRKTLETKQAPPDDVPAPAPSPATVQSSPVPLLERRVNEKIESVSVDAFNEEAPKKQQMKASTPYRSGVDPYREQVD